MIKFCKRWLGFSDAPHLPRHSPSDGLGLLVAADFQKPPNVLVSHAVKPAEKPLDAANSSALPCCNDSAGGGCDGLLCCTESLGFESSDEIGAGAKPTVELARSRSWRGRKKAEAAKEKAREAKFPPPLPSLKSNGQRSSYLRAVRKDGRILITEVRMAERPETLRVCREDGRLKLDLVRPKKESEEDEDEQDDEEQGEEAKEETARQRMFPLTSGDGFRRCHGTRSRQRLYVCHQRCVTTT